MVNKTRITSLILGVLAATALAACGGGTGSSSAAASSSKAASSSTPASSTSTPASSTSTPTSSTSGSDVPNVPVVEGKVTFYFHFKASDKVASLPSYISPFMDGCVNNWNQHPGTSGAVDPVEFKLLDGTTDVYYGQAALTWADVSADAGYQLTLGYNASAKVGNSMMGVDYTMKSDYCNTFSGLSHPVFAEPKNSIVNLMGGDVDYQTFSACPVAPVVLKNYTLTFDASGLTDAPTYVSGYMIKGSFNNWNSVALTQDATTKTTYSIVLGDVIASAQVQFCIAPITDAIHDVEDAYLLTGTGTHLDNEMDTTDTTKIKKPGNLTYTPLKLDGDDAKQSWGKLTTYTGYTWPTAPVAMTDDVTLTFTNSNADGAVMPTKITSVRLVGTLTNWTPTDATNDMTKSADGKSYTFTIAHTKMYIGVIYQFKIVANAAWDGAVCGDAAADTNMTFEAGAHKIHLDVSSDWSLFGTTKANGTVNYYGDVINGVTITLKNSGTAAMSTGVTSVSLVGTLTNWDQTATANDMTKAADGSYSYALADNTMFAGTTYELKVVFNHVWTNAIGSGTANMSFTAVKGQPVVTISADFALCFVGACDGVVTSAAAA